MYDYYVNLYIYIYAYSGWLNIQRDQFCNSHWSKKNTPMIADIALNAQIKLAKIPMISPIPG